MAGIKSMKWVTRKLDEKKQYTVCISKEGLFSVAVVTALSMLSDDNKTIDCVHEGYAVLILNMDIKQKTAIELALSDYLVAMDVNDEETDTKSTVWK